MSFELWCAATAYVPGKESTGGGVAFQKLMHYLLCRGSPNKKEIVDNLDAKYFINDQYSEQWDFTNASRRYKLQYAGAKGSKKEDSVHSPVSQSLHTQSGGGVGNYSGVTKGFEYLPAQEYANWQAAVAKAPCSKTNWLLHALCATQENTQLFMPNASHTSELQFATNGTTQSNCQEISGCLALGNLL
eukprot:6192175-Pleurochrysis_carterae.AAC.1